MLMQHKDLCFYECSRTFIAKHFVEKLSLWHASAICVMSHRWKKYSGNRRKSDFPFDVDYPHSPMS